MYFKHYEFVTYGKLINFVERYALWLGQTH